jgi:hypothetical protein
MTLIELILRYALGHKAGRLAKMLWMTISIIIGALQALHPVVSPFSVAITSFIPSMQVQNLVKVSKMAEDSGIEIDMASLHEPILGIRLGYLYQVAAVEVCVLILVLIYMWPIKIAPRIDRPLPFYYPFTPSFWCGKKQTQVELDQLEMARPLLHPSSGLHENE